MRCESSHLRLYQKVAYIRKDVRALARLHVPKRATLDCAHSTYRTYLFDRYFSRPLAFRRPAGILRLFRRGTIVVWRYAYSSFSLFILIFSPFFFIIPCCQPLFSHLRYFSTSYELWNLRRFVSRFISHAENNIKFISPVQLSSSTVSSACVTNISGAKVILWLTFEEKL